MGNRYDYPGLIAEYRKEPERFVTVARIRINGKYRKIVQYRKNADGRRLRSYHETMARYLHCVYESDPRSFAYKKGCSTLKCVNQHLGNDTFLKTDIHAFFDSVTCDAFMKLFLEFPRMKQKPKISFADAVSVCFFENSLPIGFVSSPVISDIYLNRFDQAIAEAYPSCAYTHYADDIIVSAQGEEAEQTLSAVRETIERELAERSLKVNEKKTYLRRLKNPGDAIHLLGLNLVRRENKRYEITVSDSFLRKTSMDFCDYVSEKDEMDPEERESEFSRVFGRIGYITANSARSSEKLRKMLSVKLDRSISDLTRETLLEL